MKKPFNGKLQIADDVLTYLENMLEIEINLIF